MGIGVKHLQYRTAPTAHSKTVQFDPTHFASTSRHQRVLVVGFDTEYQPVPGKTDNQVISYQFSAEVVWADGTGGAEWRGVILPNSLSVADRLSIPDFLSVVISEGVEKQPCEEGFH